MFSASILEQIARTRIFLEQGVKYQLASIQGQARTNYVAVYGWVLTVSLP